MIMLEFGSIYQGNQTLLIESITWPVSVEPQRGEQEYLPGPKATGAGGGGV